MEIELKNVTTKQIPELACLANEIWHECFTDILSSNQIDYMVEKFQSERAFIEYFKDENYAYYFILYFNSVVGYMGIKREDNKLFLSKLYVKSEYRRKGIAGKCIDLMVERCKIENLTEIYLTVNKHNERAISAYLKNGFIVECEQVADIGCGYVMDDYVMKKRV